MGISHDIKPRRVVKPHAKHAAKNTSFDLLVKPKEEPIVAPQFLISADDFEKKETLENDFFNPKEEHKEHLVIENKNSFFSKLAKILSAKRLIWAAAIIITGLVIYQNYADIKTQLKDEFANSALEDDQTNETPTVSNTETQPNPTSGTSTTTETTTPATTTTPTVTTPTAATVSIKLLNGNGVSGSAEQAGTILTAAGYTIAKTGNAKTFTYTKTYIYYKTGKETEAEALKAVLTKYSTVLQKSDSLTTGYDIVIVIGKN